MRSDLESRLAKLKDETTPQSEGLVADPNENHEVRAWVRKYIQDNPDRPSWVDGPDWRPRDPVEWENKIYASYATQPEPERGYDWDSFRIGRVVDRDNRPSNKYNYFHREAIPKPRFPNPGQPATMEMWEDFRREENLWREASSKLSYTIHLIRIRETQPDYFNSERLSLAEELAGYKEFLKGVWAGKALPAPTDGEIEQWVFPETHKPSPGPGQRLVVFTDCAGNKLYEVEDERNEVCRPQPSAA